MRAAPLISIVVPRCNHGHFLAEALRSVTTSLPTEIIVVDDGSTDATADVLATLRDTARAPLGHPAERRARAGPQPRVARESWPLRRIPRCRRSARAGRLGLGATALDDHPECAFVFGRCTMMDRDGTLLTTPRYPRILRDHYRELLRRNYIWTPAVAMFRREAVERAGDSTRR